MNKTEDLEGSKSLIQ